ncbi:hypothetical protein [Rubripirellula reticaptiva]|uniref:hypothetical protein n=1 Tax=Rubripirellula reticaptiva TaxID=2528013 RepID=UPI0011B4EA2D|nr:hypothetical protein [Rubripirellula reticaptiva]
MCGRPTIIAIEFRGNAVGCRHCGGTFVAAEKALDACEDIVGISNLNESRDKSGEREQRPLTLSTSQKFARLNDIAPLRLAASLLTAISNLFAESI